MVLQGCESAQPLREQTLIEYGGPVVTRCTLRATAPALNGDLLSDTEQVEQDWATCAAKVDSVYEYQQKRAAKEQEKSGTSSQAR
ncbi:Rz1-like lysis system protein LysC [Pseudomonas lundensis]|uniref:Rz1-like lysis system protein LysC n=1 Tax=Pseudomonas lundensis TaxID=86185 RepID=UPI0021CF2C2F|nr:Rz1-like lysis system protein LysC [Pseudomonas lundensis]